MKENRKPHVFVLRLAAVLLILVALSSSMVAGRYARYTTSASGSDSARVARFEVTQTNEDGLFTQNVSIHVAPGLTSRNTVSVTNSSEVAVNYRINVNNTYKNLPLKFEIEVGGETHAVPFTGTVAPNSTATYTLLTTWNSTDNSIDYAGKVDLIQLALDAVQID